jgi:subtilisin
VNSWPTLDEARSWLKEGTGREVKIAVLDSGIDASHPDLRGMELIDDVAIVERDMRIHVDSGGGRDLFGHGTAIAGIIRKVAPEAQIGSFRVLGEHLRSRSVIIREGVRQALDGDYQILNCSFGCAREDQVLLYKEWIDEAYVRDRHIVAACNNTDFTKTEWPGHFPSVLTVNSSNCGKSDAFFWKSGHLVEFAAGGHDIEVAWAGGGIKKVTGSSFAAPLLAGLLARLISGYPGLPPLQAKALLRELAEPLP